jgi:cobalt-zinc-cadmium efflux system membrane fusion protein
MIINPTTQAWSRVIALLAFGATFACTRQDVPEDDGVELAGGVVTMWTDSTELFMEYPALLVGNPGTFAVHLTDVTDFTPLLSGVVTLRFEPRDGGEAFTVTQEVPRRPGIYGPAPAFPQAGVWDLTIFVESPQAHDVILVPGLRVYPSATEAPLVGDEVDNGIPFLKEQQWNTPGMRTEFAASGSVRQSFEATGAIVPTVGRYAEVSAPLNGFIEIDDVRNSPAPGQRVTRGQVVATLTPTLGESGSAFAEARRALREAEDDFGRAQRLFEVEAVPERRLREAEIRLDAAREALRGLTGGQPLSEDGVLAIRSPISGVVVSRTLAAGVRVAAGERLFAVVDPSVVWLRVNVPVAVVPLVSDTSGASFQLDGFPRWYQVTRTVSVGSVVDSLSRTVPVLYEVTNPDRTIRIGAMAQVAVRTGRADEGVVIPSTAILDEDGRPVAYVQISGERFEKRELEIGAVDGQRTLVLSGIALGDRVVTGAAYQIRLASLSTSVPAEGHAH